MELAKKKIGIWGYGVTGKSAIPFFKQLGCEIGLIEKKSLTSEEQAQLAKDGITLWPYDQLEQFLMAHDAVLTSGSIDLRPYHQFSDRWLAEVDIMQAYASQRLGSPKVIAITGTVGKTTITRLLAHILRYAGYRVAVGGNIGVGMLSLLHEPATYDYLLLELSSYQLEISRSFTPDVALFTNFYPNHLDRHGSEQNYFDAKAKIFAYQRSDQWAVMPPSIAAKITTRAQKIIAPLNHAETNTVTYPENIALCQATLQALSLNQQFMTDACHTFERDEHRLEMVGTVAGVAIYNDSKSTVPQATIAAVHALQSKPIILLLGGVSKGVDRSSLLSSIQQSCNAQCLKTVICFGAEANELHQFAQKTQISSVACSTLDEAWSHAILVAQPGDQVLLSPAGASFDLFKDYQERGNMFKKLVHQTQREKGSL